MKTGYQNLVPTGLGTLSRLPYQDERWVVGLAALLPMGVILGSVPFELIIGLTILLWIIQSVASKRQPLLKMHRLPIFWPLSAWFLGIMLSRVFNGFTAHEFLHDLAFIRYMLFIFAIVDVSERLSIDRYFLSGISAAIIWAGLNTFCAFVLGNDFIGNPAGSYFGKLHEAERISALCAYVFPLLLFAFLLQKARKQFDKYILPLVVIFSLILLITLKIRTSWLAAGIGLMGGCFLTLRGRYRWVTTGIIATVMGGGGYILYSLGYENGLNSIYDRLWIWKESIALWKKSPILGVGVSTFTKTFYQDFLQTHPVPFVAPGGALLFDQQLQHIAQSHNLFLHLLSCTGLWGLLAFAWLVAAAAYRWRNYSAHVRLYLGVCPFVLFGASFTGWTVYDSFYGSLVMFFIAWMSSSFPSQQVPVNRFGKMV